MATFELDLSPQQPLDLVGSLAVVGQRIVPLGIAIEMVLGALRELYSARAPELRDLRAFGSPPLESLRRLCATLDERTARFRVSGWVEDEARGQPREEILVDGAFAESSLGHARSQPPPLMAADESQVLAEPYPLLTARGYEIGPALRALGEVRQRPGRAEAMLEPVPISELFVIDPVLSAAGFQLVQLASIDEAERTPRVITSIERVSVFPSAAPVAELTLEESGGTSDRRATIHGLSAEREPVFVIEGVRWSAGKDAAEQRRAAFIAHITKLVSDLLPDRKLGASDDLVRCGARSLDFVRIVSALRSDLGCEVALSRLIERPTIEGIAELCIESGRAADPVSWSEEAVEGLGLGAGNLSYAQEQLWFLEQLGDLGCAYNEGIAIEIESVIDAAAFERALAALTARHGALRSCFVGSADSVRRQPSAHGEPSLHGIDLTGLSEVEARQRFLRATRDAMRQAFDLASGPLVRALVASSSARSYVALLAHHIIVDGWSLRQVVLPELATLYESELAGRAAELPEAPAYGKFVHWERATVAAIAARPGAFDWWRSELQDLPSVLALPLDQPRPLRASHRGRVLAVPVEPELWAGVTELAAGQGVTTFVVLLAAYELLLATYGRQSKLCVGVIAANRMRSEHERVVGLFANLLPLRAEVLPEQSVVELLASIRQRVYASVDRQSIPFSRIVAELGVPRDLSVNPLVQAVFAFEEPPPPLHFGGANADLLAIDNDTSKFDLTLTVKASADDRSGVAVFEYREDLFTEATARELARTWTWLLHRMVERPSASLGELPWVDPEQAMQIIGQSSGRRAALPSVRLHERFEEQARRTPDAVAVSHADRTLTYRELNARANRLAHWLVMQGAERDAAIGVRVRRSSELLVAVLGILKAGAAYLPLDRALPVARTRHLLADARPRCVLGEPDDHDELPGVVGDWWTRSATLPDHDLAQPSPPDSLAYVIYTSGSTGQPKGVMVEHRNLDNFSAAMDDIVSCEPPGRWLAGTSLSFDISVLELLWPLTHGFTVVLHEGWNTHAALPTGQDITHLQCTPSGLRWLLLQPSARTLLAGLRHLLVGGENLPSTLVSELRELYRGRLTNLYGPTETTVWSASHDLVAGGAVVPIGHALLNTQLLVLDEQGRILPRGAHGELYIGGAGVTRGYLNQAEATQRAFLPRRAADGSTQRWYRSGDLVRAREDFTLEFLGRLDEQVKLRGHRVEPAEVAAAIQSHPDVSECAIDVRSQDGDASLVAYVAIKAPLDVEQLRDLVRRHVPEYMVPQRFELLDALPRTIGGKLDHVALRARPASEATPPRQGAESASALQLALLEIWRRVLGASHVGLHDDFFALGGDSIAALRLVGYVQQELGYPLALRALVASRTVAAIAAHLEQEAAPAAAAPAQRARCRWVRTPITPPTVAAAALSAIPMVEHRALRERLSRARNASERAPVGIFRTPWGEIGLWLVPLLDHELIGAQPAVCTRVRETVSAAVSCGARGVALTGLLASSTDYGRCVGELSGSVALTTGHAATAAAVLLTLRALLRSTGRTLKHERLAVLGVGSIGRAVLELVLQRLPHPEAIVLCDLPSRRERLEVLARQLVARGTRAAIEIVTAGGTPGSSLYSASVILGATSVADVLDIARLRPGTLVVDDSAPHCFSPADAIARMSAQRDIVACEAGSICAPSSIECSVFADEPLGAPALHELDQFFGVDEREIMACTLAALLPQTVPGLAPTLGEPSVESSVAHVEAFARLGIAHATPRLGATPLPEGLLGELAQRYGFTKPGA